VKPLLFFRFLVCLGAAAVLMAGGGSRAMAQAADAAPKAYVVALGLSDEQKVFRLEAAQAARVLGAFYGRGGETVVRPNPQQPKIPRAADIAATLDDVVARMDRERDILMLFLTSHGSPQGVAVASGRRVEILGPRQLGALLRRTGVTNKVVIVSACFSGVFTALADPHTLVITASDAAHPSFGCSHHRVMTNFGYLYLNKSVPETPTLPAAYALARSATTEVERGLCGKGRISAPYRRITGDCSGPSNPQMAGGDAFARELRAEPVSAEARQKLKLDVLQ
jgi:hypothetical protein